VKLASTMADNDAFVRELHHRVKNNFQIIASLVSLQKRTLPTDRRDEMRFVEEHVQSMAAAYRMVSVTDGVVQVALRDLVSEVVDALRQIVGLGRNSVNVELPLGECFVRIDQAIAMALYLAVLVPPYLDSAATLGGMLRIAVAVEGPERVVLSIAAATEVTLPPNPLRRRLIAAYVRQLHAEVDPTTESGATCVRIRLQPLQVTHFG
jgi:two-component sensor histidine kinase